MTAVQPKSPLEAAMLGLPGLGFPATNGAPSAALMPPTSSRGLFGGLRRRTLGMGLDGLGYSPGHEEIGIPTAGPPPISSAPPPPANWQKTVGADLMAQLPQTPPQPMLGDTLPPSPSMRGGMFGNVASVSAMPDTVGGIVAKIGNRGATLGDAVKARDKPAFFGQGGVGRDILGRLGDALAQWGGGQPLYAQTVEARKEREWRSQESLREWQRKMQQPDYATIGNRRFSFNPATGQAQTLYVAPTEAEDYAASLGFEPGTDGFKIAMQDYYLRHSGPTATANAMDEEDNRQDNRVAIEGVRQNNRIGLEGVRQGNRLQLRGTPTYRDNNPRPRTTGGGGSSGGVREGQTATNPQTGAKVIWRGGKWVPAK